MEISTQFDKNTITDIVKNFDNDTPISLKDICCSFKSNITTGIINGKHSLVIPEANVGDIYKDVFYKAIQSCQLIQELYINKYIFFDVSVKNKNPDDLSNKSFAFFLFVESAGLMDLGRFIMDNWTLPIIPNYLLKEIANREFITPEERRYKGQLKASYIATAVAFIVGILSPIILSKCTSDECKCKQINQIETIQNDINGKAENAEP